MKTDRYTKTILTIIAACLLWIALGRPALVTPASAQDRQAAHVVYVAGWVTQDGARHPLPPSTFNSVGVPVTIMYNVPGR